MFARRKLRKKQKLINEKKDIYLILVGSCNVQWATKWLLLNCINILMFFGAINIWMIEN